MTTFTTTHPGTGRVTATRVIAGLFAVLALFLLGGAFALAGGFADPGDIHAMHSFGWAAMTGIILGGSLVALTFKPSWDVALWAVFAMGAVFFLVSLADGFDPAMLLFPAIGLIVWAVRGTSDNSDRFGLRSKPIAAAALVALIPAGIYAWNQIQFQTSAAAADPHALEGHYTGMAAMALVIPIVGLLAATGLPGWRVVGWLAGVAAVIFGVGSLVVDQAGQVDDLVAVLVIAAGLGFVAMVEMTRALAKP